MSTPQDELDGTATSGAPVATAGRPGTELDVPAEPATTAEAAGPAETGEPTTTAEPATSAEPTTSAEPVTAVESAEPTTTPVPAEDDRWVRFGPAPETVPGRIRRLATAVGRIFAHEWTLASLAGVLIAVFMTWPTLRDPTRTIPHDTWDPTLQAWQVAWAGHIITSDPAQLWHGNAFWPEQYSYAFSDSLLGYFPFGLIGTGPVATVLRYNILYVLAFALASVGTYALVRQLGAGRTGAAVAGLAFAYAPWRLAQAGHLHVLSSGGIALALAMLARGHGWSLRHGYRPERRHAGWALAGWLVAAWQVSLGFGIGLPFAYVLLSVIVVAALVWYVRRTWFWAVRRPFGRRLLMADLAGGLIFGGVALMMAKPYLTVAQIHPYAKRSPEEIALYSPVLRGFFTAPEESWLWGDRHAAARAMLTWPPEMALLPGFVLYGLAAAGLVFSIWRLHVRLLLAAGVALTLALGMGTQFADAGRPGYLSLYGVLPGWDAIRTPGRLVLWTTLLLGILAAGAVSAFVGRANEVAADRVPYRPGMWLRLATVVPIALVLLEGVNQAPPQEVPAGPVALHTAEAPVLILPTDSGIDQHAMLWSTDGFPTIVNGSSGFTPASLEHTRELVAPFPDAASVAHLRDLGVRTVILLPEQVAGTPWEHAAEADVDGLGITREEVDGAIVFRLN